MKDRGFLVFRWLFALALIGYLYLAVWSEAGAGADCELIFRVKRQAGTYDMINSVRPNERIDVLDCNGRVQIRKGGIP